MSVAETVVRPATAAFEELERAVRHLGEELSFFRRRALEAERRLKELATPQPEVAPRPDAQELTARVARLEAENADLRARLAEAAERTRGTIDRMRFLRQQQEGGDER